MTLECLCGDVRVHFAERPDFIHECNCTLCRKTGARWSYLNPASVTVEGETRGYRRADKDIPAAETHSCPSCGATSHFVFTEEVVSTHGNTMMGVNMNLADPADLKGIEVRFPNGAAWSGAGDFGYVREAVVL